MFGREATYKNQSHEQEALNIHECNQLCTLVLPTRHLNAEHTLDPDLNS